MSRLINAPANGPACSMEDLVAQYIDYSPSIYNSYPQGFYMSPEQMQYCPTKGQIKNSAHMSVTLYKEAYIDEDTSLLSFRKGTTYKFNGAKGQFPKLYVLDMNSEYKSSKEYTNKELVRLCDVSAYYNEHTVTFRLNGFTLNDNAYPIVSDNVSLNTRNVQRYSNPAIFQYIMTSETYFTWKLQSNDVSNISEYDVSNFSYSVLGRLYENGDLNMDKEIYRVSDIEDDIVIDIQTKKRDRIDIHISTSGNVYVIDYLNNNIDLSDSAVKEKYSIVEPPATYGSYKTSYYANYNKSFNFKIMPEEGKEDSLVSYNYILQKNGKELKNNSSLSFDQNIIYNGLTYSENGTVNTYTLWVGANEKYVGNEIIFIINNENQDSFDLKVRENEKDNWVTLSPSYSNSRAEYSYVLQKNISEDSTNGLFIQLSCASDYANVLDSSLITGIYAIDNRGNKTTTVDFGPDSNISSAEITWKGDLAANTYIRIVISRITLIPYTIVLENDGIRVLDLFDSSKVVISNKGQISRYTTKSNPKEIDLQVYNDSSLNTTIYKLYGNNQLIKTQNKLDKNFEINETSLSTYYSSYRIDLTLEQLYVAKTINVIINNNTNSSITITNAATSSNGTTYEIAYMTSGNSNISSSSTTTASYYMSQGYYFSINLKLSELYKYGSCNAVLLFDGVKQSETMIICKIDENSHGNFTFTVNDIPGECSVVDLYINNFTEITTYNYNVIGYKGLQIYRHNDDYEATEEWEQICPADTSYITTLLRTSTKNPYQFTLKIISEDNVLYPELEYNVYDNEAFDISSGTMSLVEYSDTTTKYGLFNSEPSWIQTYKDGLVFAVTGLVAAIQSIYITTNDRRNGIIIKDNYNNDAVIVDYNTASTDISYDSYTTTREHLREINWEFDLPNYVLSADLTLYGNSAVAKPTDSGWNAVGSIKRISDLTNDITFKYGTDLNGNTQTEYSSYYLAITNVSKKTLYVDSAEYGKKIIITDNFNSNATVVDFSTTSSYAAYYMLRDHLYEISWNISLSSSYQSAYVEVYGTNTSGSTPADTANWTNIASYRFTGTTFMFDYLFDEDESDSYAYSAYYIKLTNLSAKVTSEWRLINASLGNFKSMSTVVTSDTAIDVSLPLYLNQAYDILNNKGSNTSTYSHITRDNTNVELKSAIYDIYYQPLGTNESGRRLLGALYTNSQGIIYVPSDVSIDVQAKQYVMIKDSSDIDYIAGYADPSLNVKIYPDVVVSYSPVGNCKVMTTKTTDIIAFSIHVYKVTPYSSGSGIAYTNKLIYGYEFDGTDETYDSGTRTIGNFFTMSTGTSYLLEIEAQTTTNKLTFSKNISKLYGSSNYIMNITMNSSAISGNIQGNETRYMDIDITHIANDRSSFILSDTSVYASSTGSAFAILITRALIRYRMYFYYNYSATFDCSTDTSLNVTNKYTTIAHYSSDMGFTTEIPSNYTKIYALVYNNDTSSYDICIGSNTFTSFDLLPLNK